MSLSEPHGTTGLASTRSKINKPEVQRARTGCLTCRRKRRKCDEIKHTSESGDSKCAYCLANGLACEWPGFINVSGQLLKKKSAKQQPRKEPQESPELAKVQWPFSPVASLSDDHPVLSAAPPHHKRVSPLSSLLTPTLPSKVLSPPQFHQPVVEKPNVPAAASPFPDYTSLTGMSSDPLSMDAFNQNYPSTHENRYLDLSHILREYMYVNAFTTNSKLEPLLPKEVLTEYFVNVEKFSVKDFDEPVVLKPEQEILLLKNYVENVGAGMDMFDTDKTMVRVIPQKMKSRPALRFAVLALSSRWFDSKVANYPKGLTVSLYHESLRHLAPTYNDTSNNIYIIVTCVILCVFEMMSSEPRNWKQHLEGCVLLLKSYKITGLAVDKIERATFWVFIRMDVCHSVINESPTILPSEHWVLPNMTAEEIEKAFDTPEMHGNYIVYLASLVVNLVYGEQEDDQYKSKWLDLWVRLRRWELSFEDLFSKTYEVYDPKIGFPRIFFANSQAISSTQMYHMSCILMIQNKPHNLRLSQLSAENSMYPSVSLVYHARRIIGISITNSDYGAYSNSIQPLYVAGLILTSRQDYGILLNALHNVEKSTGWATQGRMNDLMKFWCKGD
ncbi:hypothetical protein KL930_004732 [Ogataea haglerorum]|nr:hypothetical protein KL951_004722 [Ogataea haglerorum]KAG7772949.1 hypothetical protein KL930_004732 [Ogataea haglerorum]KAG7775802.1 hypothetical protein KL922_004162 [Ogataea haglerorum]